MKFNIFLLDDEIDWEYPGNYDWFLSKILGFEAHWQDNIQMTFDLRGYGAQRSDWEQLVRLVNAFYHCDILIHDRWHLIREAAKNLAVVQSFDTLFKRLNPIWDLLELMCRAMACVPAPVYMSSDISDNDARFFKMNQGDFFVEGIHETDVVEINVTTRQLQNNGEEMPLCEVKQAEKECKSACASLFEKLKLVNVEEEDLISIDKFGTSITCRLKLLFRVFQTVGLLGTFRHNEKDVCWKMPSRARHTVPCAILSIGNSSCCIRGFKQ